MAVTPLRAVRIPDDVWDAAKAAAERDGVSISDAIRVLLTKWAAGRVKV